MNDSLGRGYARIEAIRPPRGGMHVNPAEADRPPSDRLNLVYATLFMAGVAFLLPFNSFIMAVDYFQEHYPNSSIMFDISMVYITSACVAVVANNVLLDVITHDTRIFFGSLLSLFTMIFVAVFNIGLDRFTPQFSYHITLLAIGMIACGCTVQQASYYGFTGNLPPKYTQAVMVGESAAGFWVSIDRMATKATIGSTLRFSTLVFFAMSIVVLLAHSIVHHSMMKNPLVLYYMKLTQESKNKRKIQLHLNPNDEATLIEGDGIDGNFGVLKLQSPIEDTRGLSFANPLYSPTSTAAPLTLSPTAPLTLSPTASEVLSTPTPSSRPPSYKVEDVVFETKEPPPTSWRAFKERLAVRWMVGQAIYPYMVSIGLVYFTTLSLYPGIASEIPSCTLNTWMPIVLMSCFNFFDFIGKISAAYPYEWSRSQLLMASGVRLLLVPLMLLCAAPRHSPHIVGDVYPIMFSIVMGFSNGLFGSVPMIQAPTRVSREHREIAGNMMTLSYNGGLLSGALVSYLLLDILGPATGRGPSDAMCRLYNVPVLPTLTTTTTTTLVNNASLV